MNSKIIGNNLLELRKKYKKTTKEVANSCNISRSAISMYENGKRIPRDDIKIKLANYYNVSIEEIFTQFSHKTRQKRWRMLNLFNFK